MLTAYHCLCFQNLNIYECATFPSTSEPWHNVFSHNVLPSLFDWPFRAQRKCNFLKESSQVRPPLMYTPQHPIFPNSTSVMKGVMVCDFFSALSSVSWTWQVLNQCLLNTFFFHLRDGITTAPWEDHLVSDHCFLIVTFLEIIHKQTRNFVVNIYIEVSTNFFFIVDIATRHIYQSYHGHWSLGVGMIMRMIGDVSPWKSPSVVRGNIANWQRKAEERNEREKEIERVFARVIAICNPGWVLGLWTIWN